MQNQPNILFIFTDQQHSRMMSCAGNRHLKTPAMDSLAAEGVRFDRAYCTNPVCIPSRFSLMTGRMPSTINLFSNYIENIDEIPDHIKGNGLGHLMSAAGYDAAYAGKVHLPKMSAEDVGFNYICEDEREGLTAACVEFIKKPRQQPFFLVASFINPHDICHMAIWDAKSEHEKPQLNRKEHPHLATLDAALARPEGTGDDVFFARHCPELPPNFDPASDEPDAIGILLDQRSFRRKVHHEWNEKRWREHRWAYARLTEIVDRQIGIVLDALKDSRQADRTLVVFTSDHGDMDSSRRMEHKSTLYDEACRIPLIIRPPGGMTGRVDSTHLVSNGLDLMPTFCDWAGVAPPPDLAGKSLRPLVQSEEPCPWRQAVPVESATGNAIITEQFKYCRYDIGKNDEQLIDLRNDLWEQKNAVNKSICQQEIERMRSLFRKTFGDRRRNPDDVMKDAANA